MDRSEAWLSYFLVNADETPPDLGPEASQLERQLRAELARSMGRFYLGESGEGRIAHEARQANDPALDPVLCEALTLYIREEGRHARALARAVVALGHPLPRRHWTESLFRRGRRLLGLRTKMLTITAAEVVGLVYYGLLAERVPAVAPLVRAIARDEDRHLSFQAEYFGRAFAGGSIVDVIRLAVGAAGFVAITTAGVGVFLLDHGPLLRRLRVSRLEVARRAAHQVSRALAACARAREGGPVQAPRIETVAPSTAPAQERYERCTPVRAWSPPVPSAAHSADFSPAAGASPPQ
jgi:hypothetical protein